MAVSPFFGIEIGLRALQAHKLSMEALSHNVANANTPGYSRQQVNLTAADPYTVPGFNRAIGAGQIGSGVEIVSIARAHDDSLTRQIRDNVNLFGEYETLESFYRRIEATFNEPGATGLSQLMDDFYNAWRELATSPESSAARALVQQKAKSLTDYFNRLDNDLIEMQQDVDNNIRSLTTEVNTLLRQLGDTNELLAGVVAQGDNPNDLLDRRDYLLEQLSSFVDIQAVEQSDLTVNVYINGRVMVQDDVVHEIVVQDDSTNKFYAQLKVEGEETGADLVINNGELKALFDMRDDSTIGIAGYIDSLDQLAYNLADAVNTVHRAGYGLDGVSNRDFFIDVTSFGVAGSASRLALSVNITDPTNGLRNIAAASLLDPVTGLPMVPGDGSNALAIAQIQDDTTVMSGLTANQFYDTMISQLGIYSQEETKNKENQEFLLNQLQNLQDSVSGVNLDEEAAKMITFENAYNAASQVIRIMDNAIQTLIEMLGN